MDPLSQVRQDVWKYVGESGKNPQDDDVRIAINAARRIVYPLGDWKNTIQPIALEVHRNTITLPSWGEVIRVAYFGRHEMHVENSWYAMMEGGFNRFCDLNYEFHDTLIDLGQRFATFRLYERPFRIKVIGQSNADIGTVLTFHCISDEKEPILLTRIVGQAWDQITADPVNDKWVTAIEYCEKPVTKDRIRVHAYDPVRGIEEPIAIYEAIDINPQLRRYQIPEMRRRHRGHPHIEFDDFGRSRNRHVLAKVKKKFVELTDDRQLVDIHTDALIHLLQAITARENRNTTGQDGYATQVAAAQSYLNSEIRNEQPMQAGRIRMQRFMNDTQLGHEHARDYPSDIAPLDLP